MLCISGAALGVCTSTDDMGKVKREQSDVRRKVKETSGQLDDNRRRAAQSLRELNAIDADIDRKSLEISRIENNVAACDAKIALITDSMKASEARLSTLRSNYAAAVRKMQRNLSSADRLSFILSSSSLHEAWRRMRYLKQFSKWRDRQAEQIHEEIIAMDRRKRDVEKLRGEQVVRNRALQNARTGLEQQRSRQNEAVAQIKREEKHLNGVLEEQNRRAEALDRELDRLIRLEEARVAEEQRKERERKLAEERRKAEELEKQRAAEAAKKTAEKKADDAKHKKKSTKTTKDKKKKGTSPQPVPKPNVATPKPVAKPANPVKSISDDYAALTGSFESNKGKLPYPIGGSCRVVRTFGKQRHPELRHVMTDNGGIDLEAPHGAVARAVFAGKVSAVFSQPGYGMVVMVRHGHYLTIYVGLESLTVTTGTEVKAGQALGIVADDADGGDRALLHFEIRHEKTKLNPMDWLR